MTREELFLAIGMVEESRLARTELAVQSPSDENQAEDKTMYKRKMTPGRMLRNGLVAVLIVSMLTVTAFAATGFLLFDSPREMITTIFGDKTGFDHSDGGEKYFEDGGLAAIEPTFDRVPANETVIAEEIAPNVDAVGQSITFDGYKLTVDSFMYDSTTQCGFVTYLLENPNGLPDYQTQPDGEIWLEGVPDVVDMNQSTESYLIQEKTTDTCIAIASYFKADERRGENLEIYLESQQRYTPDQFEALIAADVEKLKQEMTPEEAMEAMRKEIGEERFEIAKAEASEEEFIHLCYSNIVARETAERIEREGTSEPIVIPLRENQSLSHITAGNGSVILTPISMRIDIRDLSFLHTDSHGNHRIHCDNMDSVKIQYQDGTEYVVFADGTVNYSLGIIELPPENVQTEVKVSPEEDPYGEGYIQVVDSHDYCLDTLIFNRIIDINEISAVLINDTLVPLD